MRDQSFFSNKRLLRYWSLLLGGIFGLLGFIDLLQYFPVLPFFYPSVLLYRGIDVLSWILAGSFFFWWWRKEARNGRMRLISWTLTSLIRLLVLLTCGLSLQALRYCPGLVDCQYTHKASLVVEGATYHVASMPSWDDSLAREDFYLYRCDPSGLWCHQVKNVGFILHSDAVNKYPYSPSGASFLVIHHHLVIQCKYGSESIENQYLLP